MYELLNVIFIVTAGFLLSLVFIPIRLFARGEWENVWLPFSAVGFIFFPAIVSYMSQL